MTEVSRQEVYRPLRLNQKQMDIVDVIRTKFDILDQMLCEHLPPGRYRYNALHKLEEASMQAIKSVSHDWDIEDD